MNILDGIMEKEDRFIGTLNRLQNIGGGYKTYIYGDAIMGKQVKKQLALHDIIYDRTVVNQKYWSEKSDSICLEELLESTEEPVNLIIAFKGYRPDMLEGYADKINAVIEMDCWAGVDITSDKNELTYEWLKENAENFQEVLDMLQDDLSRKTLFAYLNQKISSDYKYLEAVRQPFQYFDEEINKMSEHEVFVDCGAYDGDSALGFIDALHRRGYSTYDEIISFEPAPDNYQKLKERNLEKHVCIQKGVADERKTLYFSQDGTVSKCVEDGAISIELDSIDHVMMGKRVTMIKMDVEGEELSALHGAQDTIRNYKPVLAICVYHKREDLLEIPQYIRSLVPEYKFYLRAYDRTTLELVLYAVL